MSNSPHARPPFDDAVPPSHWPHSPVERGAPGGVAQRLSVAAHLVLSDAQRAAALCEEAVALARGAGDTAGVARSLCQAAEVLLGAGHPDRAGMLCVEAHPLLERMDDRWRATRVLQLRAQCCLAVGEHGRAGTLLQEAAARFDKIPDRQELARSRALLATALGMAGELDEALRVAGWAVATLPPQAPAELDWLVRGAEAQLLLQWAGQLQADGCAAEADGARERALLVLPEPGAMDGANWNAQAALVLDTIVEASRAHGAAALHRRALLCLVAWARRWRSPLERGLAWAALARRREREGRSAGAIACARHAVQSFGRSRAGLRLRDAGMHLAALLEASGDVKGAYDAYVSAMAAEAAHQHEMTVMRARMVAVDHEAEEALRRTEQTLSYAQRMSNVGHLVASVNHELNQPMASIRMLAETSIELLAQGRDAEVRDTLGAMLRLSRRLNDVAAKLAAFPDRTAEPRAPVRLADVLDEALELLRSRLAQTPCAIERELGTIRVLAYEGQLLRVIVNLVNNSLDATALKGQRRIAFSARAAGGMATLKVSDNGPGLAATTRERLFQPFFSTKAAGQGLGLGLALSRDVMRAMGGDLRACQDEAGAVFELTLPHADG